MARPSARKTDEATNDRTKTIHSCGRFLKMTNMNTLDRLYESEGVEKCLHSLAVHESMVMIRHRIRI